MVLERSTPVAPLTVLAASSLSSKLPPVADANPPPAPLLTLAVSPNSPTGASPFLDGPSAPPPPNFIPSLEAHSSASALSSTPKTRTSNRSPISILSLPKSLAIVPHLTRHSLRKAWWERSRACDWVRKEGREEVRDEPREERADWDWSCFEEADLPDLVDFA